jgi:hypothetical protein
MKKRKVVIPESHPLAWKSQLWPHEELIRSMRRARHSWPEIAACLQKDHGIKISYQSVRNFFVRASDPKRRRRGVPTGWPEPETPQPATSNLTAQPAEGVDAKKEPSGHTYEQWVETQRQKEKTKPSEPFKTYE